MVEEMEEERKMIGFKCKNCGRINYPGRTRCLTCKGREFEEVELGNECELVTYTQIYNPPVGIDVNPPLMIGLVKFPNGVRVLGQLDIAHPDGLEIGKKLKPVWDELREVRGEKVYGFKFELAGESTSKEE